MSAQPVEVPVVSRTMKDSWNGRVPETKVLLPHAKGRMQKAIYSVNIGDYAPELTALTYPFLKHFAKKIGASFELITERCFEGRWPVTTEKFQGGMLGRERGDEWVMVVDSDTLIHPDCFDFTEHVDKDTVMHNGKDLCTIRWQMDEYFRRDARWTGSCTWFTCASDWCFDIWQPLDLTFEDACSRITVTVGERNCGVNPPEHLIDDYTCSRNIARYGLKFKTFTEVCQQHGMPGNPYLYHLYTHTNETKFARMLMTLIGWGVMTQPETQALAQKWGIVWDQCPGIDGKGGHHPQQLCPVCGGSGVANARKRGK